MKPCKSPLPSAGELDERLTRKYGAIKPPGCKRIERGEERKRKQKEGEREQQQP